VTAAADFIDNNSGEESAVEPVRCVVSNTGSWTHPPLGIVKINFDAALNQEKRNGGDWCGGEGLNGLPIGC